MLTCKSTRCRGKRDKAQLNLNFDERFRFALHFINRRPWEILAVLQVREERSRGESESSDWALKIWASKSNSLTESDASRMTENLQKPSNCSTKLHQAKSFFVHRSFSTHKILSLAPRTTNLTCPTTAELKNWKGNKPLMFDQNEQAQGITKNQC